MINAISNFLNIEAETKVS